jgi:hypothetical protein
VPAPIEEAGRQLNRRLVARHVGSPPMSDEVRDRLRAVFREDVLRLQDLIGRDLSRWLN